MPQHTNRQNGDEGEASLNRLELRCPPLPQTLIDAMELADRAEEVGPEDVVEIVEGDPLVTAHLLQTVNSIYYGLRRYVSSVRRAVVLLGPVSVTGVIISMKMLSLRAYLEGAAATSFTRLIRHSVATAFAARCLSKHVVPKGLQEPSPRNAPTSKDSFIGECFTAGLLHDFGKILLIYNFPGEAAALYEEKILAREVRTDDPLHIEQLVFGCDHAEAGERAAHKLRFPGLVSDVIRLHHRPLGEVARQPAGQRARIVIAANQAAKAMGHGFTRAYSSWEDCLAHPVWKHLSHYDNASATDLLVEDLQAQQEPMDEYVRHLSSTNGKSVSPHRLR